MTSECELDTATTEEVLGEVAEEVATADVVETAPEEVAMDVSALSEDATRFAAPAFTAAGMLIVSASGVSTLL